MIGTQWGGGQWLLRGLAMVGPDTDPCREMFNAWNSDGGVEHYSWDGLFAKEESVYSSLPVGPRLLEIGCGAGRVTRWLRSHGHQLVGIDYAPQMVVAARKSDPELRLLVGNANALPFASHAFESVIFSFNGLDFLYPYQQRLLALQEIRRVLVTGGTFVCSSLNNFLPRSRREARDFLRVGWRRSARRYRTGVYPWGTITRCVTTPRRQVSELRRAGFTDIKVVPSPPWRHLTSLWWIGAKDDWSHYVCRTS